MSIFPLRVREPVHANCLGWRRSAHISLLTRPTCLAGVVLFAHTLKEHGSRYPFIVLYTPTLTQAVIAVIDDGAEDWDWARQEVGKGYRQVEAEDGSGGNQNSKQDFTPRLTTVLLTHIDASK
ncbi:glycosyltransferase family 8 protein [Dothistroma septosporum NZE10]|uniref:Glycosyltransferase family 8 protein n=1 Tax=Dothistroma septosporum (strain NZE10 / CBS 128990) TaxID=675120 RepID=N1PTW5_DOTSN|nr:glycosyltransferase family 8 protein [Dothistroma septosporum NZE10]